MSAGLCLNRPAEYWDSENDGARLALLICGACTGCPLDDADPYGVIRQGVAYGDTGRRLPICGDCGYPIAGYRGGPVHCPRCLVPDVFVPTTAWLNRRRVLALAELPAREVARRVGISANSVWRIRGKAAGVAA